MRYITIGLCAMVPVLLFSGCTVSCANSAPCNEQLTIMSYNAQTFFDADDSGTEYREFTGSKTKWSAQKYAQRLERIADVISNACPDGPDIVVLQELENQCVLTDIKEQFFGSAAYPYAAYIPPQNGQSIMNGILSRIPITHVASLQIHNQLTNSESPLRATIEASFEKSGYRFVLFACHWKSKLSTDGSDTRIRQHQAAAVAQRIQHLQQEDRAIHIIVAGDFNESHFEHNALLYQEDTNIKSGIRITDRTHITGAAAGVLYEPWLDYSAENAAGALAADTAAPLSNMPDGSYFYKGEWESIDHILLSSCFFDGNGAEFLSFFVPKLGGTFYVDTGAPSRYSVFSGNGYSDHFPVAVTITLAPAVSVQ